LTDEFAAKGRPDVKFSVIDELVLESARLALWESAGGVIQIVAQLSVAPRPVTMDTE
jgi:hypothetical protein